jgi:hypothetical protein
MGFACGDLGLCAKGGETCSCTAGQFIACDADAAVSCNAEGNGITTESCGAPGCNADGGRCNACTPDTITCSADMTALDQCGADGLVAQSDACAAGCIPGTSSDDRCGYIEPAWLPDVCDELATAAEASLSGTLDTQQDAQCTGGVVEIDGTTFCIVRAAKIGIGDLKVTGTRAIAFVADETLEVTGILDVSADGSTSGPGAGTLGRGGTTFDSSFFGAGGAGFVQTGGRGGGNDNDTLAGTSGGPITQRLTTERFVGGAPGGASICGNGTFQCFNNVNFLGGGGGGGALLIACRGEVSVTGTIDAGGGGGSGGGDHATAANTVAQGGGAGGGSGGFVVFQGLQVTLTGKLYANGGGGGAGCATDNCRGLVGANGRRATTAAPGGDPAGNTCGGGSGGSGSSPPGIGENTFSNTDAGSGGGGGSVGQFLVFTPSGITPVLAPAEASPTPVASSTSLAGK